MLVPFETVTGLSVFCLMVTHGTPRQVVSSWIPPESVNTILALLMRHKKSKIARWFHQAQVARARSGMYVRTIAAERYGVCRLEPSNLLPRARCMNGKYDRHRFGYLLQRPQDFQKRFFIIDIDGRWSVTSAYGRSPVHHLANQAYKCVML